RVQVARGRRGPALADDGCAGCAKLGAWRAGRRPGSCRVESGAEFVEPAHEGGVERRDLDAAPVWRVDDQALHAQQAQRLDHRLPRHAEPLRSNWCTPRSTLPREKAGSPKRRAPPMYSKGSQPVATTTMFVASA